jgi:DNA-directed RNA polymerase specialized sigma24 family protein
MNMDQHEFEACTLPHLDAAYGMALQLDPDPERAADLVEGTYLRALTAADRFDTDERGNRVGLFKTMYNEVYESNEKENRPTEHQDEFRNVTLDTARRGGSAAAWDRPALDWESVDGLLKRAIGHLQPEDRLLLFLWGAENLTYREIGFVLDTPVMTSMIRLCRARDLLARKMVGLADHSAESTGSLRDAV